MSDEYMLRLEASGEVTPAQPPIDAGESEPAGTAAEEAEK